ncbi:MAG: hypothetical protein Q9202_006581 [Teloschistes flavicans]
MGNWCVSSAFSLVRGGVLKSERDSLIKNSTLGLIDDILNAWGRLDVWVCSSGLLGPPSITNTTPADLQKCFEANTYAPFFALKYAPPAMGKLCEKRNYPNAESKTVTGTGVRINCISPGQIDVGVDLNNFDMRGMTAQLPPSSLQSKEAHKANTSLERAGLPTEVARVAGFLASGFSSYITGANLVVDGGAS